MCDARQGKSRIACLGWGSLVWNPGDLPLNSEWQGDGPLLPLEFARQSTQGSSAGTLTLVLVPGYRHHVSSLWALLRVAGIEDAITALGRRERIPEKRWPQTIGRWTERHEVTSSDVGTIATWASQHRLHGVVWTALGPRYQQQDGRMPTVEEALGYLGGLSGETRRNAEDYVRKAPPQISTPYRERFKSDLGWG